MNPDEKECPFCSEIIEALAQKCKQAPREFLNAAVPVAIAAALYGRQVPYTEKRQFPHKPEYVTRATAGGGAG